MLEKETETEKEEAVDTTSPAPKAQGGKNSSRAAVPTVLTEDITVHRHKLVHNNIFERNSRSVGVTQIRLLELGYASAGGDKTGFLGDDTLSALADFQKDNRLADLAFNDERVLKAIFKDTPVTVAE
jgi:hypothetical protein